MSSERRRGRSGEAGAVVRKVIQTLRMLPEAPNGWGVRELAAAMQLPKSTVHRLLQILQTEELVRVDPSSGRYLIGVELYRLAVRITEQMDLRRVATSLLHKMVADHNETAVLAAYMPHASGIAFIDMVQCSHPVRYVPDLGQLLPMDRGASGKAILAYLPMEQQRVLLAERSDSQSLLQELAQIRRMGYALSFGERIEGAVGIAAPYFSGPGEIGGCLMFTIPQHRFSSGAEQQLGPAVQREADKLTGLLGGSPAAPDPK